jgi:hypothetical protein
MIMRLTDVGVNKNVLQDTTSHAKGGHKCDAFLTYLNESDFVRDAIRHRLSEIKVIKCRDVDYETAKKEILGYFKSRGESYPDEASVDLELDFDLLMKITEELRKEGRLVEA